MWLGGGVTCFAAEHKISYVADVPNAHTSHLVESQGYDYSKLDPPAPPPSPVRGRETDYRCGDSIGKWYILSPGIFRKVGYTYASLHHLPGRVQ